MAEIKTRKSSDSFAAFVSSEKSTCSRQAQAKALARTSPWLTTEWVNGNVNFDSHFKDYEIESPAVALQEAVGGVVKWVMDSIITEFGSAASATHGTRGCGCVH
ncbi:hypothetical protein PV08_08610 [Exophiala spinifera]|uniref:Uncharacterized protein n=1 Tax=Exophiala spinifera TaxID=91928 RepID=A0A0D1ZKR4_9EURO|nr:uncharacterized protein PV08_08610 [Exophiala spinifera]KIW13422.1 hypothetical protein PV08_08610 [Exophiala spinifera]